MVLFNMRFEILDISGDIGIKAYGTSCEEAFVNAGTGMYNLITDVEKIEEKQEIAIEIKAESIEGLLVKYLNELIFYFDTYGFVGKRIEVVGAELQTASRDSQKLSLSKSPNFELKIKVCGEEFDPDRHERRLLVKAATYHNLRVEGINGRWEVEVIFDI